jgi:glutaredoxin-like protein NrdH
MPPKLEFTKESGEKKACKVRIYALSTCGFCRRALNFLRDNKIEFEYVYVDKLPRDLQDELVDELEGKYDKHVAFPFLILDNKDCYVGFNPEKYQQILDKIIATEALKGE